MSRMCTPTRRRCRGAHISGYRWCWQPWLRTNAECAGRQRPNYGLPSAVADCQNACAGISLPKRNVRWRLPVSIQDSFEFCCENKERNWYLLWKQFDQNLHYFVLLRLRLNIFIALGLMFLNFELCTTFPVHIDQTASTYCVSRCEACPPLERSSHTYCVSLDTEVEKLSS